MKILGTGLNGLIGSRIIELLPQHQFENISRSSGVDIINKNQVEAAIEKSSADVVVHLAAMTDVKGAELEKDRGEESSAWKINVLGTEYIAQACQKTGKKLVYISTDLVFDGENAPEKGYEETDQPNPVNWYAKTKYEGELRVQAITSPWIIMRTGYPYRAIFPKKDFVRVFQSLLEEKKPFIAITDRIITPTFIDDIAVALDGLLKHNAVGIYNTTGSEAVSIYDAAKMVAQTFELDASLIGKTTRKEFLVGKPAEPFNSSLCIHKLEQLGMKMHSFQEGLHMVKEQQQYA
jgi:dTDP-4-dehydrorhamnose reductase